MTPFREQLIAKHKERLARIAARAVPDHPVECVSASVRSSRIPARPQNKLEDLNLFQEKEWIERQVERFKLPEPKIWFSIADRPGEPSIHLIQRVVCDRYQMRMRDMQSARRIKSIVKPRQVAMWLCRHLTSKSFPYIGHRFGGRDHSTVVHAVERVEGFRKDPAFASELAELIALIEEKSNEAAAHSPHRGASTSLAASTADCGAPNDVGAGEAALDPAE